MSQTGVSLTNVGAAGSINISGITVGISAEELVAVLEAKGVLRTAETAGLERRVVIMLAQRLKPGEALDFDQAVKELERTVDVALDVITRGERGTNHGEFIDAVLARVAERTRAGDLDGGANEIDRALAEEEVSHRQRRVALLEEGVKVDTLRRDPVAVVRRIERIVAANANQPTSRPAWLPEFQARLNAFREDGEAKGINFSLLVAIELARRMATMAREGNERGVALTNLGNALQTLGGRESGTARLEEAVAAYRAALEEYTRERVPLDWAATQMNLGTALQTLGGRESGTARLEEAMAAFDACLMVTVSVWPIEWVSYVRARKEETGTKSRQRTAG